MFETTEYTSRFLQLSEVKDYRQLVYAAERMYGTGGFGNSVAMCTALEGAAEVVIPEKAQYIRTILMELSMMQENLLRLAAIAETLNFDSLSMMCWTEREKILEILDDLTGNRMILSMCVPGGVRKSLDPEILEESLDELNVVMQKAETIKGIIAEDSMVKRRLRGVGVLAKEAAQGSSVTGPGAKGSGVDIDRRMLGEYGAYRNLDFVPVTETGGDCLARCMVKIREVIQSGELIRKAVENMPEGSIRSEMPAGINGEWIAKIEQPDGVDTFYISGSGSAFLDEIGVRTAGESNQKIMDRLENVTLENEALIRLTLGIDSCLKER